MDNLLLREFNAQMISKGRITFGDVKRLQRNILPDGICTRDDVELLLALDRVVARCDRAWGDYLVAAVTDFVVWGERPTGYVDADAGRWLNGLLLAGEPTRTALRIAREIEQEAHQAETLGSDAEPMGVAERIGGADAPRAEALA
jgi:hypothetical protein